MKTIYILKVLFFSIGVSSLSIPLSFATAQPAQASFACGPHYKTYRVRSLSGAKGAGVRCLGFPSKAGFMGVWYGEGTWGNQTYRHIGAVLGKKGEAADIHGNGETTDGSFPSGSLQFKSSGGPEHKVLKVTGAWNEEWILEKDGVIESYNSSLPPVKICGKNFIQFQVKNTTGEDGGIRCLTDSPNTTGFWYGEGRWGKISYLHLGLQMMDGDSPKYSAYDICEPSKSKTCGAFKDSLQFSPNLLDPSVSDRFSSLTINVTGDWSEKWIKVGG